MDEEASKPKDLGQKPSETHLSPEEVTHFYKLVKEIWWIIHTDAGGWGLLSDPRSFEKMLGTILVSGDFDRVVEYFLKNGAATSSLLVAKLGLPDRSVRSYISQLNTWQIIVPARKARTMGSIHGDRGRIPDVWQVPDATDDQINEAIQLHRRTKSPKYRVAEAFAQSYLHDYLEPRHRQDTSFTDLLTEAKARGFQNPIEIADLACQYFNKETTIRAWR